MDNLSFKERVARVSIEQARIYKRVFVEREYLLCSTAFLCRAYYIISAKEDNFRHLIGINTNISAGDFFERCQSGDLTADDFDFIKRGRSEKEVKGSVRRKVNALPYFNEIFNSRLYAQESFSRNGVICSIAATDCDITVGFIDNGKSRPKSLLKGNCLDPSKAKPVDLILCKQVNAPLFNEIVYGDKDALRMYYDKIRHVVCDDLLNLTH